MHLTRVLICFSILAWLLIGWWLALRDFEYTSDARLDLVADEILQLLGQPHHELRAGRDAVGVKHLRATQVHHPEDRPTGDFQTCDFFDVLSLKNDFVLSAIARKHAVQLWDIFESPNFPWYPTGSEWGPISSETQEGCPKRLGFPRHMCAPPRTLFRILQKDP